MMLDTVRYFVGEAPVGFEYVEYIIVACVFLILFSMIVNMFRDFSKFFGGR